MVAAGVEAANCQMEQRIVPYYATVLTLLSAVLLLAMAETRGAQPPIPHALIFG